MLAVGSRGSSRLTFTVLVVAVTAFALIQSLILPVLGGLAVAMDTDRSTATWLLTAYLLSASVATPILGRLGDAWGKERVLVGCLAVLAVGCAVSALAPSIVWMILGRAIQGAGGGIMPVSFGIIRDELPARQVPTGISVISSLLAFGIGGGIVLAGPVVDLLGYSALFWLPCVVSALAAGVAFVFVPQSPVQSRERFSTAPALLMTGWLISLVLGISQAPQWGWTSLPVVGLLVAAAVLLVVWTRVESTARVPLVDIRLMRRRGVWTANAVALLVGFGLYSSSTLIPQLVQTSPTTAGYGLGVSVTESGLMMLPSCLASFLVGLASAPAAARVGAKALVMLGCITSASGLVMLALLHAEKWQIYVGAGLTGLGTGLTLACLANLVVAAVPVTQTGVATGMNANLRTIGGAIGSAVLASVLAAHPGAGAVPSEAGYVAGLLTIFGVLLVAALCSLAIPSARRISHATELQPLTVM